MIDGVCLFVLVLVCACVLVRVCMLNVFVTTLTLLSEGIGLCCFFQMSAVSR